MELYTQLQTNGKCIVEVCMKKERVKAFNFSYLSYQPPKFASMPLENIIDLRPSLSMCGGNMRENWGLIYFSRVYAAYFSECSNAFPP